MSTRDFGRYSLVKKLATGGMAEVYLAHQKGLQGFEKHIVIKKILPHLADDDEFVSMFLNEARIAARFSHPNIVQIYDLGREAESYYIAMEYIHGEDLGRVMKQAWSLQKWIPQPVVLRVIAAACEGLYYAHTKADEHGRPLKVVHRDISPQNIIVTFDGGSKLVDFGIARAADQASHTATGAIKGKFAYMAPEQASGKPVDHRTDIFALGLVLYELLTGVRPFKRDSDIATLRAVLDCNIQPPSAVANVPKALDPVVMKALERLAEDRYQDAQQFQLAIENFLLEQKWNGSTIKVAEFMKEIFAERLADESRLGRPDPRGSESASGVAIAPALPAEEWDTGRRNQSEASLPRLASSEFDFAEDKPPPPMPTTSARRKSSKSIAVSREADSKLDEAWEAAAATPRRFDDEDEEEATQAEPALQRPRKKSSGQVPNATVAAPLPVDEPPLRRSGAGVPKATVAAPLPEPERRRPARSDPPASARVRRKSLLHMNDEEVRRLKEER
ncbi:MAG: protein kinase domain-containing protein, partial [Myxococcales bacterium]